MALTDGGASFNVVVVQFNGGLQRQKVVSVLRVSASGLALHAVNGSVRCQAAYHDQMQVRVPSISQAAFRKLLITWSLACVRCIRMGL